MSQNQLIIDRDTHNERAKRIDYMSTHQQLIRDNETEDERANRHH